MFRKYSFWLRALLAVILLVGLLIAGMLIFRLGFGLGLAQASPIETGTLSLPQTNETIMPWGIRWGFGPHLFGLMNLLALFFCGSLFFVAFFGLLTRPFRWHRPGPWAYHHGHWPHEHGQHHEKWAHHESAKGAHDCGYDKQEPDTDPDQN